jgi:glycosyltransferase involved in cell wall biosynthesis
MRIAMIGTRGVPARYGGFETAIEEIGQRLVARGHEVVVYCRGAEDPTRRTHLGMELVHLPAARRKTLETLSHTALSVGHLVAQGRVDAAIVFNAANAPFVPALRARGIPVAVHVDGLEWKRSKWKGAGRRYYRAVEAMSVRLADALIADASGIADYYADEFGAETELLTYGAPVQDDPGSARIEELDLQPDAYHLVVARFEPENHVLEIVEGYQRSDAELPLVVVGSAPYADDYTARIERVAASDPRIRLLGGVWDQEQLDQLYANALTYLHGHSVGGTNPSLLRAMGAGTAVLAFDVGFNREVLGIEGDFFASAAEVADRVRKAELNSGEMLLRGWSLRERARNRYRWDDVAAGYEELLNRLSNGYSIRGRASGRRRPLDAQVSWARPVRAFDSPMEPGTEPVRSGRTTSEVGDPRGQGLGDLARVSPDSRRGPVGGRDGGASGEEQV